jgi:hypothetical protein
LPEQKGVSIRLSVSTPPRSAARRANWRSVHLDQYQHCPHEDSYTAALKSRPTNNNSCLYDHAFAVSR